MSLKNVPLIVCAFAAIAVTSPAGAQFTTAVVPPRTKAKMDTTVKQDSVRRATVALAARVTDMKKWVDSAAGVSVPATDTALARINADTARAPLSRDSVVLARKARVVADSAASIATVEVHDSTGLKASDTASAAPPTSSRIARGDTKAFASGAPAPATASTLPLLALAGLTVLVAGVALRRP